MGYSKGALRLKGLLACGVCALFAGMLVPAVGSAAGPGQAAPAAPASVPRAAGDAGPPVMEGPPSLSQLLTPVAMVDTLVPGTTGITLDLHGTVLYLRLPGADPAGALAAAGLRLGPGEAMIEAPPPVAAEGAALRVRAVRSVQTSTEVTVPRSVREAEDPTLPLGSTTVDAEGSDGVRLVITETRYEDDQAVEAHTLSDQVTTPAVDRVVRRGTKQPAAVAPVAAQPAPAPDGRQARLIMASRNVTAYCLTGRTATGSLAGPGSVAVDPAVIPLGSHLYIPGYGYGWAVDTGGGIHGDAVDVWLGCDDAIRWGRKALSVYVLES